LLNPREYRNWAGNITVKERRELQDMAQVYKQYKLVHGIDKVSRIQLFEFVPTGRTRLAADPLNIFHTAHNQHLEQYTGQH
jgi:hypothetical protein